MKVLGSFVDCVCEPHLYKEDIGDIKTKLISRLPDKRICEMASVLIIDTKYDAYEVLPWIRDQFGPLFYFLQYSIFYLYQNHYSRKECNNTTF